MRRIRKDHSGSTKDKLPPVPDLDLVLYHWSPTKNRKSINRYGLLPERRSLQDGWRAPYICFSDEPWVAWCLSGNMFPEIDSWDLWMCYERFQTSFDLYEIITDTYRDTGRTYTKEYRIYTRVYKRDLTYIATRRTDDR